MHCVEKRNNIEEALIFLINIIILIIYSKKNSHMDIMTAMMFESAIGSGFVTGKALYYSVGYQAQVGAIVLFFMSIGTNGVWSAVINGAVIRAKQTKSILSFCGYALVVIAINLLWNYNFSLSNNNIVTLLGIIKFIFVTVIGWFMILRLVKDAFSEAKIEVEQVDHVDQMEDVMIDQTYGYMDLSGNVVIEPKFMIKYCDGDGEESFSPGFSDGMAKFYSNGKYGFINKTGDIVIDARYDNAYDFIDGFAWVESEGKYGIVDKTGNYSIEPEFEDVLFPDDDLIGIMEDGKYGYADRSGNIVIEPIFSDIYRFVNGYAFVSVSEDYKKCWGSIDKEGEFIAEPAFVYDYIGEPDSSTGLALVKQYSDSEYTCRYINHKFETIIALQCLDAHSFSEGLAVLQLNVNSFCYIDIGGNKAFENTFYYASDFCEGMACVQLECDNLWGFINKNGEMVIQPQFERVTEFHEGLACVYKDGKYGYIDKSGEVLIPLQYYNATDFLDGLAFADEAIINREGKIILNSPFGCNFLYNDVSEGLVPFITHI